MAVGDLGASMVPLRLGGTELVAAEALVRRRFEVQ